MRDAPVGLNTEFCHAMKMKCPSAEEFLDFFDVGDQDISKDSNGHLQDASPLVVINEQKHFQPWLTVRFCVFLPF